MKTDAEKFYYISELKKATDILDDLTSYISQKGVNEETLVRIADVLSILKKLHKLNESVID